MNSEINEKMEKEEIEKNIEMLRDILNEICATAENNEELKKRLTISERLDELIVKYMNANKKQVK